MITNSNLFHRVSSFPLLSFDIIINLSVNSHNLLALEIIYELLV